MRGGEDTERCEPDDDPRVVTAGFAMGDVAPGEFCYVRVLTADGDMAWSSPLWPGGE